MEESERKIRSKVRKSEEKVRGSQKKKGAGARDAGVQQGGKVAKLNVFPMICGSGGLKNRFAKTAGAKSSGQSYAESQTESFADRPQNLPF